MAIKFQYNKTSLQMLEKQLKIRKRSLPTIKSKESALRVEVKRARSDIEKLAREIDTKKQQYGGMSKLWKEFDPSLIKVDKVHSGSKKIAGVVIPFLEEVSFSVEYFSIFNAPKWYLDGVEIVKSISEETIRKKFYEQKLVRLEYARKKTTQKVNLFEKVQIPGYEEAILKIKRYMEDEENLSKSVQKIMKSKTENE